MINTDHIQEKLLASTILYESAEKSSAALDTFAGWLLGGFGAAMALLISNVDSINAYVSPSSLKCAGSWFFIAAIITVIEKYLAVIISSAAQAAAIGRESGAKVDDPEFDPSFFFQEIKKAVFPPFSCILDRSFKKVIEGDLAASARTVTRWAILQSLLVIIEAGIVLFAAFILFRNLTV